MVIYTLLAIPLKSYLQPLVVMASIPFGFIGAILGHQIMNFDLVFFSLLGMIALAGVVINSSLVLVDFINRNRRLHGMGLQRGGHRLGHVPFPAYFPDIGHHVHGLDAAHGPPVTLIPRRLCLWRYPWLWCRILYGGYTGVDTGALRHPRGLPVLVPRRC